MSFAGIFKKAAPFISTGLGLAGPVGVMAGNILNGVMGQKIGSPDELATAFAKAPDQQKFMLDLKNAEEQFALQMKQVDIQSVEELAKIAADDRADARKMQVETKSYLPSILAIVITVGFLGLLGGMMFGELKVSDNQALLLLLGSLSTSFISIISYYFGSSAGSDRKTELLANGNGTATANK